MFPVFIVFLPWARPSTTYRDDWSIFIVSIISRRSLAIRGTDSTPTRQREILSRGVLRVCACILVDGQLSLTMEGGTVNGRAKQVRTLSHFLHMTTCMPWGEALDLEAIISAICKVLTISPQILPPWVNVTAKYESIWGNSEKWRCPSPTTDWLKEDLRRRTLLLKAFFLENSLVVQLASLAQAFTLAFWKPLLWELSPNGLNQNPIQFVSGAG